MRLKKGFTLAEILIVLMVIGAIATMTIPSLMKGVTEAQLKAGYKKAYNAIVNLAAMEKVSGQLPSNNAGDSVMKFFASMNSGLSVVHYADDAVSALGSGNIIEPGDYSSCLTIAGGTKDNPTSTTFGQKIGEADCASTTISSTQSGWMVTDDNLAYTIAPGGNTECPTKLEINGHDAANETPDAFSCAVVWVDVNGLTKGPNRIDKQIATVSDDGVELKELSETTKVNTLTGDQYPIFLGSDGATAGPKTTTVTGRIAADLK